MASTPTHIPASLVGEGQVIETPPPPSHHLSAADDLVTRFQLHDSYRILLHPFRKDLHRTSGGSNAAKAQSQSTPPPQGSDSSHQQTYTLPKTFAHYLPASLPGKVRPAKPPRKNQLLARRAAAAAVQDGSTGGQETGGSAAEQKLARQHAEWDKASTTLRRVVYKAEYEQY